MDSDNTKDNKLSKKAEEVIQKQSNSINDRSNNLQEVIHELRVRQVELETENQELREAQRNLEHIQRKYLDLYNFAPVGYFTLDKNGIILDHNFTGTELVDVERKNLNNNPFIQYIAPLDRNNFNHHIMTALETGTKQSFELKLLRNNDIFHAQLEIDPVQDDDGNFQEFSLTVTDITDNKKSENYRVVNEELRRQRGKLSELNQALLESEKRMNRSQEIAHLGSWELDILKNHLFWSDEVYRIFGLKPQEFGATYEAFLEAIHPDDRESVDEAYTGSLREGRDTYEIEHRVVRKGTGEIRIVNEKCEHFRNESGDIVRSVGMVQDITERKKVEFERETTAEFLRIVNESTSVQDLIHSALTFFKHQSGCEAVGIRLQKGVDYPYYETRGFSEEFILLENHLCKYDRNGNPECDCEGNPVTECMCGNVIGGRFDTNQPFFTTNGSFWTNSTTNLLASATEEDRQGRTRNRCNGEGYESVALIPLHSGVENFGLLQLNDRRKNLFSQELILIWERLAGHLAVALAKFMAEEEIIKHDKLLDSINQIFQEALTFKTESEVVGKCLDVAEDLTESEFGFFGEIHGNGYIDDRRLGSHFRGLYKSNVHEVLTDMEIVSYWGRTVQEEKSQIINHPDSDPDLRGLTKDHPVITSFLGVPIKQGGKTIGMMALANKKSGYTEEDKLNVETLTVAFVEALMRKRAEIKMSEYLKNLENSNRELEQFAYITSHDLREPLRMITSFLQLLERRYRDELDKDAHEFIGYAVDGAKRLDTMTNDLLKYSKISSQKREIAPVNFEHVMEEALINLKVQIEENNAVITHDPLPTIDGDEQLEVQLLQNLIGNSIKYRSQETPKIHISSIEEKNQYLFSIKDNGIGMSPDHLEQIFTIFQRLHTHAEYEGTGIGLAIAQKIVHQQGGEIWAESEPGKGTTFYFTLPYKTKEYTDYF